MGSVVRLTDLFFARRFKDEHILQMRRILHFYPRNHVHHDATIDHIVSKASAVRQTETKYCFLWLVIEGRNQIFPRRKDNKMEGKRRRSIAVSGRGSIIRTQKKISIGWNWKALLHLLFIFRQCLMAIKSTFVEASIIKSKCLSSLTMVPTGTDWMRDSFNNVSIF